MICHVVILYTLIVLAVEGGGCFAVEVKFHCRLGDRTFSFDLSAHAQNRFPFHFRFDNIS